jgi:hypothetical protein
VAISIRWENEVTKELLQKVYSAILAAYKDGFFTDPEMVAIMEELSTVITKN